MFKVSFKGLLHEEKAQGSMELILLVGAMIIAAVIAGQWLKISATKAAEGVDTVANK